MELPVVAAVIGQQESGQADLGMRILQPDLPIEQRRESLPQRLALVVDLARRRRNHRKPQRLPDPGTVVGTHAQDLLFAFSRLLEATQVVIELAEIAVGERVVRLSAQGIAVGFDGLVEPALLLLEQVTPG